MYRLSKHAVKVYRRAADGAAGRERARLRHAHQADEHRHALSPARQELHGRGADPAAPVYAPEEVAEAILHCAQTPERDLIVAGGGKLISVMGQHAPRLADKAMGTQLFSASRSRGAPRAPRRGPVRHRRSAAERGRYEGHVRSRASTPKPRATRWRWERSPRVPDCSPRGAGRQGQFVG
jgi:hypothetical protein